MSSSARAPENASIAPELTLLVPCFNEACGLAPFHVRLTAALEHLSLTTEVLYINDGSRDETANIIDRFSQEKSVRRLHLLRNIGKEAALRAGIKDARGDAVIMLDCDLQDPPEMIPLMVQEWRKGVDIVNMQHRPRQGGSWLKRTFARLHHEVLDHVIDDFDMPTHLSDFRLIGPDALAALRAMDDKAGALKILVGRLGFSSTTVNYHRKPRQTPRTHGSALSRLNLCAGSILACSPRPLRRLYRYVSPRSDSVSNRTHP